MFVDIVSALKTEGAKRFLCVIYEFLNIAYHIAVTLPKELRHFQRGGAGRLLCGVTEGAGRGMSSHCDKMILSLRPGSLPPGLVRP